MRGELLVPNRVQANTTINIEDRARFPDLGTAVARHLRNAVVAGLDVMALSDDNGFFDTSSGPLTPETVPGSADHLGAGCQVAVRRRRWPLGGFCG